MSKIKSSSESYRLILNRFFLLTSFVIMFTAGCDRTDKDWQNAQKTNSVGSYQQFMEKHPQAAQVADAKKQIVSLDWADAKTKNTAPAFREFIKNHPDSPEVAEAMKLLERLDWAEIQLIKDGEPAKRTEMLQAFLKNYPGSQQVNEASEMLWDVETPKAEIKEAQMLLIWSNGNGNMYDSQTQYTGNYFTSNGTPFDKINSFGDAIVYIWRDFSESELPKVLKLGLKTGVAYLKTPEGFKVIRRVDIKKTDEELRKEFGI